MANIDTRTMAEVAASITTNLNDLNEAIKQNDMRSAAECKIKVQNDVDAYNVRRNEEVFKGITEADDPMLTAIKYDDYPVKKLEEKHDENGIITHYEVNETNRRLNFASLDAYCSKHHIDFASDANWKTFAKTYALLWNLKNESDIGSLSKATLDTEVVKKAKREMSLDRDPVSNTNMVKALQKVIDAIYYVDKDGKNAYKVTTHDTSYLHKVITKAGSGRCSIKEIKDVTIIKYIPDVLYHLVYGEKYTVEKPAANS